MLELLRASHCRNVRTDPLPIITIRAGRIYMSTSYFQMGGVRLPKQYFHLEQWMLCLCSTYTTSVPLDYLLYHVKWPRRVFYWITRPNVQVINPSRHHLKKGSVPIFVILSYKGYFIQLYRACMKNTNCRSLSFLQGTSYFCLIWKYTCTNAPFLPFLLVRDCPKWLAQHN